MSELRVIESPEPFEATSILGQVISYIQSYVVFPVDSAIACALWVLHTHVIEAAFITPYLHVVSPEKESGKTTLRDILQHLCARPSEADYISAAVLRRSQDQWPPPTLLLDEVDAIFSQTSEASESLRGVLNAGFRTGASIKLMIQEGNNWVVRPFGVFSPKVLVGIGFLPDTIEGRCIPIRMKQKRVDEHCEVFRLRRVERETLGIRQSIQEWADQARPILVADESEPDMPPALSGRQQDCWSALLSIADYLGGMWPEAARTAAVAIHSQSDDQSTAVRLLRDIEEVFNSPPALGISSSLLASKLCSNSDLEWSHASEGGRPLDASVLAKYLKPFGIRPDRLPRTISESQERGYTKDQFEDAWARYLKRGQDQKK